MKDSLTHKVIFGSSWMFGARLTLKSSGLVVMLILANLLMPEDFGLIAIGTIAISLIKIFTEVGFKESLIKESDHISTSMLNTAWTVEFLRGAIIFSVVFLTAPFIAEFFNEPRAIPIIKVLAFSSLIYGFTSIRLLFLQKELDFRRQFIYEIIGILAQVFVTIPLAFLLENVWSLVIGVIAGELLKVILSYILMPYLPKVELNIHSLKKMFSFGKWYFLGVIVSYFAMEMDTYFIAKLFESDLLGIYVLAFTISNKPVVELSKAVSKVLFPTYSKISNEPERVRGAFKKSTTVLYSIVTPLCVGLSLVSKDFVMALLDDSWLDMIPILQVLALAALARCIAIPSGSIFYGLNKPKINFFISSIRMLVLGGGLIIMVTITESLAAATYAVLAANIVVAFVFILFSIKETNIKIYDYIVIFTPILISTSLLIITLILIQFYIQNSIYTLILSFSFGGLVYLGISITLWKYFGIGAGREVAILMNTLLEKSRN